MSFTWRNSPSVVSEDTPVCEQGKESVDTIDPLLPVSKNGQMAQGDSFNRLLAELAAYWHCICLPLLLLWG